MPDVRNWWNIRLAGKTKSIPENNTMWNVLTTASANPILEINFLGADAWELLGFPDQAKFNALQSGTICCVPCPLSKIVVSDLCWYDVALLLPALVKGHNHFANVTVVCHL